VMARKNRAGLYAPDLEAAIGKWRDSKPDPAVLLRFEALALDMTPGEGDWKPREGVHERALRLVAAYQKNPPPGLEARLNVLNVIFNRDRLASWEMPDAYIEWAKQRPLSQILADRYADAPVRGEGLDRARLSGWESYIHFQAAFMSALRGDATLLRGVREAFRKDPAVKGKEGTQLSTYYYNYVEETALNIAIAISRGETGHFDKLLEVFSDMTVDSMEPSMPNRSKERLQGELAICQFLANWIGAPERFEAVVNRLPDMADVGVNYARRDGLARFLELVKDNAEWLRDEFTPCREALVEAIMTRPQLAACFPGDASWTGRYEKALKPGEFLAWTMNPPSEWGFHVRPAVDAFAARKLREQKQPELAMETYHRALGECQGEGWLQFSNLMRVELAEMLMNNKRRDEARALLMPVRIQDVAEASKARYRQVCTAVGPAK